MHGRNHARSNSERRGAMRDTRDYLLTMGYLGEEEADSLSSDIVEAIYESVCDYYGD